MTIEVQEKVTSKVTTLGNYWLTWCEAITKKKPVLTATDITTAIEKYRAATGAMPKVIALNPRNVTLALPEGIELVAMAGVARYEVWMADSVPVPEGRVPFSSKRDREVIDAGGFFCHACLVGKPASDQSTDPRYCQDCAGFLLAEAEDLPANKRGRWMPRSPKKGKEKLSPVSIQQGINMATVNDKKTEVAIIPPQTSEVTRGRRGPKQKDLPVDVITRLANEGMGYKRIAARLKVEYGIDIGFRTVARVVKGERLLI